MIASLKDGGAVGDSSAALSSAEFEELVHERDMIREELNQTRFKLEQIKADIQVCAQSVLSETSECMLIRKNTEINQSMT